MDMLQVDPAGEQSGTVWDEKGRYRIAGVCIFYKEYSVIALQFMYYENYTLVKSNKHGSTFDKYTNYTAIMFDYHSEYLTYVSGCVSTVLSSITFVNNKGSYGPFGTLTDYSQFNFQISRETFGGFYGTTKEDGIESLEIYVKITNPPPPIRHRRTIR